MEREYRGNCYRQGQKEEKDRSDGQSDCRDQEGLQCLAECRYKPILRCAGVLQICDF